MIISEFLSKIIFIKLFPSGTIIPPSSFISALILELSNLITISPSPLSTNNTFLLVLKNNSVVSRTNVEEESTLVNNLLGNLTPLLQEITSNKTFSLSKLSISYF